MKDQEKRRLLQYFNEEMKRLGIPSMECQRLRTSIEEVMQTLQTYEIKGYEQQASSKQLLWERKLLDLSMRNNLLNMKIGKKVVDFSYCSIDQLEDLLAEGEELFVSPEYIEEKSLKYLYREARTLMEESGANSLFLTLGSLSYDGHQAPLLLMPVDILSLGKGRYALRRRDEQTMFNFTLVEYLRQTYGIEFEGIDPLPIDASGIDVNLVLHITEHVIEEQQDWQVEAKATLGIFSFTKYAMWRDIHTHGHVLNEHPLLRSLVEGRLLLKEDKEPFDASTFDADFRPDACALPMSCDSSQMEAVLDACNERTFILYGPPGTGKSQTITNMIANALYQDKRVLFVAQKKAALEVVEQRLKRIGMDSFCLEMHSNKVNRKHFLEKMQPLLEDIRQYKPGDDSVFTQKAEALFQLRREIAGYLEGLYYTPTDGVSLKTCMDGYLGIPENEIIPTFSSSSRFVMSKSSSLLTEKEMEEVCQLCQELDLGESILGCMPEEHPWAGCCPDIAQRDWERSIQKDLELLPAIVEKVQLQAESDMNRKFMNKSARELLENDYRWKHFCSIAHPSPLLLEDLEVLKKHIQNWSDHWTDLHSWVKYMAPLAALRQKGFDEAVVRYNSGCTGQNLAQAIRKGWLRQQGEKLLNSLPQLVDFNGSKFEKVIDSYRQQTAEFQLLTQKELKYRLMARIIRQCEQNEFCAQELTLLRRRIANKGRGTSIRGMMEQLPHLVPLLCPCMLMSPLSVAQYLDMDAEPFDLVIFDEASQIPTGEAVGAIARGKSTVIVGDPKQMPPTSFFVSEISGEDEILNDLDSILDDCISLSMPEHYLNWHYRSQHESLIAFCNHRFYGDRLNTFPSVDDKVSHVLLQKVEGYYDYGKSRTNQAEAEAIVAEVVERLERGDQHSLGLVAFSKPQSDLIEDLLSEALAQRPDLEERAYEGTEPIFVKNLENIQGDERDVVLFSVGYGPDHEGRVSMNFGPLNKAGGERRLNVAFSRARYEMKVFSTLRPEQIDERRTSATGILELKRFLTYASVGVSGADQSANESISVPVMVRQLAGALQQQGLIVEENVGTSNLRVDIAVVHPQYPDRYLLGLICDSENYHQLKTVRDREVVQPAVLKSLGWNLYHVWSLDWMKNRDFVLRKIDEVLRSLLV